MRLIITGASGFIGSHVVESAVERGHEVHAIVRTLPDRPISSVEYHAVDLVNDRTAARERIAALRASHLLHVAWYAVPGQFWTSSENFRWVAASLDLADAFAAAGGQRLVGVGTCAEYDWSGSGACSEFSTPLSPATPYGVAKNSLHLLLESWAPLANVSLGWGRLFLTYGPREPVSRLVASVVRTLLSRSGRADVTEGKQRRDFLHVRDVADALVALTESSVTGPVNIGSGESIAVRDVVAEIGRQTGCSDHIAYGAVAGREEPEVIAAEVHRLREEIGWRPQFDLPVGIADTIRWWRANLT
jgi:nucleoside-diphosphate-sugar epimerase